MKTETFTDPAVFAAAVRKAQRAATKQHTAAERPALPRADAGKGDRIAQLIRIAAYGYSPRWDADQGYCFWNVRTNARTSAHQDYARACMAAEKELT